MLDLVWLLVGALVLLVVLQLPTLAALAVLAALFLLLGPLYPRFGP
jgi:hypothetical protein